MATIGCGAGPLVDDDVLGGAGEHHIYAISLQRCRRRGAVVHGEELDLEPRLLLELLLEGAELALQFLQALQIGHCNSDSAGLRRVRRFELLQPTAIAAAVNTATAPAIILRADIDFPSLLPLWHLHV